MISVPPPDLDAIAAAARTKSAHLTLFGGGEESSDGVVYAYPYEDKPRLLKIMTVPAGDQRTGLFRLEERLKYVRFLGENGAPILFPIQRKIGQRRSVVKRKLGRSGIEISAMGTE